MILAYSPLSAPAGRPRRIWLARWPALALLALAFAGQGDGWHGAIMAASIMVAALLGSIGGFAFGPICGIALLGLVDDPVRLVQITVLCSTVNQTSMVWSLRRDISWPSVGRFVLGGLLGLPAGVWLLLHADRAAYSRGLGAILIVYCSYRLVCAPRPWRPRSRVLDVIAGVLGGVTGGAAGFPSGPVVVRCGLKSLDAVRQRAIYQPVVLVLQVLALGLFGALHGSTAHSGLLARDLLLVPASLVGTQLGMTLFRGLSTRQFSRAVTTLLLVSAVGLMV